MALPPLARPAFAAARDHRYGFRMPRRIHLSRIAYPLVRRMLTTESIFPFRRRRSLEQSNWFAWQRQSASNRHARADALAPLRRTRAGLNMGRWPCLYLGLYTRSQHSTTRGVTVICLEHATAGLPSWAQGSRARLPPVKLQ